MRAEDGALAYWTARRNALRDSFEVAINDSTSALELFRLLQDSALPSDRMRLAAARATIDAVPKLARALADSDAMVESQKRSLRPPWQDDI